MKAPAVLSSSSHRSTPNASTIGAHLDVKDAVYERIAIKDELSKSTSYNRGSLSKIVQGFRDIGDFVLANGYGNSLADDSATLQRTKEELDLQIRQYEVEMKKLYRMACTTEAEIACYKQQSEQLTQAVFDAHNLLKEDEENLERELIKNTNLQEYECLAKLCLEMPSRKESMDKIILIQGEITDMEAHLEGLMKDTTFIEQKFNVFMGSFNDLRSGWDDDDQIMDDAHSHIKSSSLHL